MIRAASGGAVRRVVQSVVVLGVLVFSTAAALLALAVLTSANQGFADAFANEHEPDIAVTLNSAKVTTAVNTPFITTFAIIALLGGVDRRQCRRSGGDRVLPANRGAEEHRVHP